MSMLKNPHGARLDIFIREMIAKNAHISFAKSYQAMG